MKEERPEEEEEEEEKEDTREDRRGKTRRRIITVISIVVGALGRVTTGLEKGMEEWKTEEESRLSRLGNQISIKDHH